MQIYAASCGLGGIPECEGKPTNSNLTILLPHFRSRHLLKQLQRKNN